MAQWWKNLPVIQETWGWCLVWKDSLEEEMAPHSSVVSWRIPWTEEPGGLQPMGSQRVRHDWVASTFTLSRSRKRASARHRIFWCSDLGCPASRTRRNKCLWFRLQSVASVTHPELMPCCSKNYRASCANLGKFFWDLAFEQVLEGWRGFQ